MLEQELQTWLIKSIFAELCSEVRRHLANFFLLIGLVSKSSLRVTYKVIMKKSVSLGDHRAPFSVLLWKSFFGSLNMSETSFSIRDIPIKSANKKI